MCDSLPCSRGVRKLNVEDLVGAHYQVLYRYAYRLTGSKFDAEDLTQQTFLTAQQKLNQLRDPAAVRAWLFRILRTSFAKLCRKKIPQIAVDSGLEMNDVASQIADDVWFDVEHLQQRLDELPEAYRVALLMFYFEGKSYEEISTELEVKLGTVMSRLARGKARLRIRLRPLEAMK